MSSAADATRPRSRVALATATLLVSIASHAVRETARDAMFLRGLPANDLPWAYLAIAIGAVAVGMLNRVLLERFSHRRLLLGTFGVAFVVDLALWSFAVDPSAGMLFALYVWTGLLGTAVTMQLWLHLADVFDVAESKRAFPLVAAGGLGGAIAGSVLAGVLLFAIETRSLLLASASLLLVAGFVASALPPRADPHRRQEGAGESAPLSQIVRSPICSGSRFSRSAWRQSRPASTTCSSTASRPPSRARSSAASSPGSTPGSTRSPCSSSCSSHPGCCAIWA